MQTAIKGHAIKEIRKVENSYLLQFLGHSLKHEANTASSSQVTARITIVPFLAILRFDSELLESPGKHLTY